MELNRKIFRANDIRGIYPSEINEEAVFQVAQKLSGYYKKNIVIGYDTRLSSPALYKELKRGLKKNKSLQIIEAGLITTPTMYFLTNHYQLDGGVMVTASHAPKEFNGLKIVKKGAQMLSGEEILEVLRINPSTQPSPLFKGRRRG